MQIEIDSDQTEVKLPRKRPASGLTRNRPVKHPIIDGKKQCLRCAEIKGIEAFRTVTNTDRLRAECIACERAAERAKKIEAINQYGGKCTCCGESNPAFLTFDHPDNDGAKWRKDNKGTPIYRWLKAQGWPNIVRIMCYNCNGARQFWSQGGECPHVTAA